jgi:hypothetical protein
MGENVKMEIRIRKKVKNHRYLLTKAKNQIKKSCMKSTVPYIGIVVRERKNISFPEGKKGWLLGPAFLVKS